MPGVEQMARQIAARCRLARESAGLSQSQAAKKLDVSRSALTEAEGGHRKISATELSAMAGIYGVNIAWLACVDGNEQDPERDRVELAARELARLKREDLDTVLQIVRAIRTGTGGGS